jgi:hypothetical protein
MAHEQGQCRTRDGMLCLQCRRHEEVKAAREIAWSGGYGYFDHQADSLVYAFKHCSEFPPHQASDHEIAALYALEHLSKEKNMASETTPKTLQTYDPALANVEFKDCTFNNIDRGIRHPITLNGVTIEASRSDPDAFIQPVRRDSLQLGDLFYYLDGGEAGDPWEVAPEDCDWQDEMGLMTWGVDCDDDGGFDMVVLVQTRAERIQEAKDEIARLENLGDEPEARGDRTSPEIHNDCMLLVDHATGSKTSSEEWSADVRACLASNARIDEKAERNRVVLQGNWPGCDDPDW